MTGVQTCALPIWVSRLSPESAAEGGELHRAGRVLNLDGAVEHLVNGVVNDPEGEVEVTLFCTRGRWNCTCECDFTPFCGHSAAVALAWLERNAGAQSGETSAPVAKPRPFADVQAPVIEAMLPAGQQVGILTYAAEALSPRHLAAVGVRPDTPIEGLPPDSLFRAVYGDKPAVSDPAILEQIGRAHV